MIKERLSAINKKLIESRATFNILSESNFKAKENIEKLKKHNEDALLAKEVIINVAENTQKNIGGRISDLVTMAMQAVMPDPYEFIVEFTPRRGTTEADLLFVRDEMAFSPIGCAGGGAIDIASLALRLSVWSISKNRPVLILDEPFRNLSMDLQEKAGLLLQELANKLKIQIIMVSHNPEIIAGADKVFRIDNGKLV